MELTPLLNTRFIPSQIVENKKETDVWNRPILYTALAVAGFAAAFLSVYSGMFSFATTAENQAVSEGKTYVANLLTQANVVPSLEVVPTSGLKDQLFKEKSFRRLINPESFFEKTLANFFQYSCSLALIGNPFTPREEILPQVPRFPLIAPPLTSVLRKENPLPNFWETHQICPLHPSIGQNETRSLPVSPSHSETSHPVQGWYETFQSFSPEIRSFLQTCLIFMTTHFVIQKMMGYFLKKPPFQSQGYSKFADLAAQMHHALYLKNVISEKEINALVAAFKEIITIQPPSPGSIAYGLRQQLRALPDLFCLLAQVGKEELFRSICGQEVYEHVLANSGQYSREPWEKQPGGLPPGPENI